jgi:hypothetical protein
MMRRTLLLFAVTVLAALAQTKYDGPKPPKPDLPYLKHASDLIPTEATQATEEKQKKDDILYVVAGGSSPVKTPLASPIFIMQADQISPDKLELFKVETKNNRREILIGPKKQPPRVRIELTRLGAGLYRIEVDESLEPGEYVLTPQGSNQAFCFQVY